MMETRHPSARLPSSYLPWRVRTREPRATAEVGRNKDGLKTVEDGDGDGDGNARFKKQEANPARVVFSLWLCKSEGRVRKAKLEGKNY